MNCGYLGPRGSHSYLALKDSFQTLQAVSCDTFTEIIEKVDGGFLDYGLLPVENSTEGAVTSVMDGLLTMEKAAIQSETIYTVQHHLFGKAPTADSVKSVYSHPQAIEQCRHFFRSHYPQVKLVPCESTSAACAMAATEGPEVAAIASDWAGSHHRLKKLLSNIQDNRFNQTRFVLIGQERTFPTEFDKTSIAFSFHRDYAGSLHEVLRLFAEESINLTRIESRPAKMELGRYVFFIDFEGHQHQPRVASILETLRTMTRRFYVLGSFPRANHQPPNGETE